MLGTSDPNQMVAGLGVVFLLLAGLWRFIIWIREAPLKPNPWDAEVEHKLEDPEAMEVCHRCFHQQPPNAWFCEHCGSAVGPYNNWMPYLHIFSTGEVLRNGVMDKLRPNVLIISGYLLFSTNFLYLALLRSYIESLGYVLLNLAVLLLFWFFLFKNLKRSREEKPVEEPDRIQS